MTDHPLNETAEITEEMDQVAAVAFHSALHGSSGINAPSNYVIAARAALRAALAVAPTDPRPWEPLNGRPVRVGDEVRREVNGLTTTAVVGRVDEDGDPWVADRGFIGVLSVGTWYRRRPVPELPTEDGAVIVPADGHEYIETRAGKKSRRLTWDAECFVWYDARGTHLAGDITHGTWKVAGQ